MPVAANAALHTPRNWMLSFMPNLRWPVYANSGYAAASPQVA
jgi:hypothetical protein